MIFDHVLIKSETDASLQSYLNIRKQEYSHVHVCCGGLCHCWGRVSSWIFVDLLDCLIVACVVSCVGLDRFCWHCTMCSDFVGLTSFSEPSGIV